MIVGLTGGIGSGKSTVADFFAKLRINIVDADLISHQLTQANTPCSNQIASKFGSESLMPDGRLNRDWLREHIHHEPTAKQQLEAILYPHILQECKRQLEADKNVTYQILMVPLLFENPQFEQLCDYTVAVECEIESRIDRVMARNRISRSAVVAILNNQLTDEERRQRADYLIYNNGTLAELERQVQDLDLQLRQQIVHQHSI